MKIYITLLLFSFYCLSAQNTVSIKLKDNIVLNAQTNELLYNKMYLFGCNAAGSWLRLDSCLINKENIFVVNKKDIFIKSYYKLGFTQEGLDLGICRDIILEQKNDTLKIELSYLDFKNDLFFEHNLENRALKEAVSLLSCYHNLQLAYEKMQSHEVLSYVDNLYNSKLNELESKKIKSFDSLQIKMHNFEVLYGHTYATDVLINTFLEPILENNYPKIYDNRRAFLKDNFFKKWNFKNELLLTNPYYKDRLYDYFSLYTYVHSFEGVQYSVDNLLRNSKVNAKIFDYNLNFVVKLYLQSGFEKMVNYIYDVYFDACTMPISSASEEIKRIEKMKSLQKGLAAPGGTLLSTKNESSDLSKIFKQNSYTVLYFWASDCLHCQESLPILKKIYTAKKNKVQIVGISLDSDKDKWRLYIEKHNIDWINSCDGKAWKGDLIKKYLVDKTPIIYIIDRNGKIVAQNMHPKDLINFF